MRILASEILAAICVLSLKEGHKLVLSAFSDYRIAFDEAFRFEELVGCLRVNDEGNEAISDSPLEREWEARTATVALINAITNCPDFLEERVSLREELGRRGLNEIIVVCG